MALAPGTKLGPYRIDAQLGAGGMGEVYRARDSQLGRDVAIKVLANLMSDPDRLRRFEQEARAAAALNHPNILAVYQLGTHEGAPYLVSELLEGQTLREVIRRGRISARKAIDYAVQITRGLAAAHEKGIVHRDLKPENLFVTCDERVKILDFGLAKLSKLREDSQPGASTLTEATEPGTVMGTVGYMSPEQVRGKPTDARSDIFSFGTILYEMLSGQRAFQKDSSAETMAAILNEDPPGLSGENRNILPAIERVVHHCLEKNPVERFQSARDLAFDLETLSGVSTASITATVKAKSWPRKWPVPLVASAALILLAIGAVGERVGEKRSASDRLQKFQPLTFRRGLLYSARFAPDGKTIIYSASWDGEAPQLYSTQPDSPESRTLNMTNSILFAVSPSTELAISNGCSWLFGGECYGTLARVPVSGGSPREVLDSVNSADWSPDGGKLAVVRQVGGKFRVEFPVGRVLYENADGWLRSIRVSPSGHEVAFVEHPERGEDPGTVVVLDSNGSLKTRSESRFSIEGLSWSPRGDEVWYGGAAPYQNWANEVHAISLSGKDRVVLRLPGVLRLHDVSREGRLLISKEDWRGAMLFQGPGDKKERDLSWLDYPIISDLSPDGTRVAFDEEGEATNGFANLAYMRGTNGAPAIKLGIGERPAFSPDQEWVVAVNASSNGGRLTLLPTGVGEARDFNPYTIRRVTLPSWTPDGKQIVFAGNDGQGWRIYAQDLLGGAPRPITPLVLIEPEKFEGNLVSPDGKYLYARDLDGKLRLYPLVGGTPRAIPGMTGDEAWLNWSNDGQSAYVFAWGRIPVQVARIDLSTGRRQPVTKFAPIDPAGLTGFVAARITPDGKSYAYTYERLLSELYLVDGTR
jgi:eukaryotic-like serine/threonine-protein kinase